jgi:hypothetical protein
MTIGSCFVSDEPWAITQSKAKAVNRETYGDGIRGRLPLRDGQRHGAVDLQVEHTGSVLSTQRSVENTIICDRKKEKRDPIEQEQNCGEDLCSESMSSSGIGWLSAKGHASGRQSFRTRCHCHVQRDSEPMSTHRSHPQTPIRLSKRAKFAPLTLCHRPNLPLHVLPQTSNLFSMPP